MNILIWPQTPLGPLWASLDASQNLTALHWGEPPQGAKAVQSHPAQTMLANYFQGQTTFNPLILKSLNLSKGTPFQQRVWQALLEIPHGQTLTYGQLAVKLGTSPRALGGAVGANPIPIIVPCHRIMGQGGKLTGFSAPGGITTKRWLLNHEGISC